MTDTTERAELDTLLSLFELDADGDSLYRRAADLLRTQAERIKTLEKMREEADEVEGSLRERISSTVNKLAEIQSEYLQFIDAVGAMKEGIASLEAERDRLLATVANDTTMIFDLCAERDKLRAEVERLRKPLADDPLQIAAALRRLVVSHAHEFGDTFYFGYVANILEACPVCHGSGLDFDDDLKDCAACQGSGKRAIESAKEQQ